MWLTPTLIRIRTMEIGDDPAYQNDPNLKYVPKETSALWLDVSHTFTAMGDVPYHCNIHGGMHGTVHVTM